MSAPAALAVIAALASATPGFSVPFLNPTENGGHVVVAADVGRVRAVPTLLDTGDAAPYAIVLSPSLSARAGARPASRWFTTNGAIGSAAITFRTVTLDRVRLGSLVLRRPSAADSPAVDTASRGLSLGFRAVIGSVFLSRHRVAIDYTARRVTFDGPAPRAAPVPFVFARSRPAVIVQVRVNGAGPFAFVLDTGAGSTVLSSAAARTAGVARGRSVALYGAGGRAAGSLATVREIAVGSARRRTMHVVISDALHGAEQAVGTRLDGVLGASFFGDRRLTIDYPQKKVWIE